MEKIERDSIILNVIQQLIDKGSWCGETHIQKTIYLIQQIAKIDCDFHYILYKHGPFSFELRDEISYLKSLDVIDYFYKDNAYGPSIKLQNNQRTNFIKLKTNETNRQLISKIVDFIGDKNVKQLEILSTTQLLSNSDSNEERIIEELISIKPHITKEEAERGMAELKSFKAINFAH